jgi:two-component system, sensor histidine kinase
MRSSSRRRTAAANGFAVCFEVRDSGPGIAPEIQARLFQPFEQGDTSITRRFGGTGLGLSICRDLLRLMGGTITVESQPEAGSSFRVVVPLRRVTVDPDAENARPTPRQATLPDDVRVLLVEDDAVNRMVMEAVLRDMGVQVLSAESGAQALALMGAETIGLVLMDCQMPELDGLSATRSWRGQESSRQRPRMPIVALTGEAQSGARDACLEAGMDDYLTKPVSAIELHRVLTHWIGKATSAADANHPTT